MNVLDENLPESQSELLREWRVAFRQIGREIGSAGMKDDRVITLLHELDRPTLFTLDADFYDVRLCHVGYCLVHLDIDDDLAADYVRRLLRQRDMNTKNKRMGCVVRASLTGITGWRIRRENEIHLPW